MSYFSSAPRTLTSSVQDGRVCIRIFCLHCCSVGGSERVAAIFIYDFNWKLTCTSITYKHTLFMCPEEHVWSWKTLTPPSGRFWTRWVQDGTLSRSDFMAVKHNCFMYFFWSPVLKFWRIMDRFFCASLEEQPERLHGDQPTETDHKPLIRRANKATAAS